jgi:uncharacterized protein YkwD
VPRTYGQGLAFVLGFWIALLLSPLTIQIARAEGAGPYTEIEARFYAEVNAHRRSQHLIALKRDPALDALARSHSEDMVRRTFFSHVNPDGQNPLDRIQADGRDDFTMAAENVGLTDRAEPNQEILQGWIASPDHRRNLNAPAFNRTGVGVARAPDGSWYYTQLYLAVPK